MRPKGVEAEKEKDENVGKTGENKVRGGDDEKEESGGDEDVLEPPVDRMFRRNREGNPPKGVEAAEEEEKATMRGRERGLHGGILDWLNYRMRARQCFVDSDDGVGLANGVSGCPRNARNFTEFPGEYCS